MKPGDLVYRVMEVDYPDYRPPSWEVQAVKVELVTEKTIRIATRFQRIEKVNFQPAALGRLFFATVEEALAAFLARKREDIASFRRRTEEAERAIAWALHTAARLPR